MALISLRNFTLPFANRVHLFTILLTGVVFAAFRLSTGAIEVRSLSQIEPKNRELLESLKEKNVSASEKKSAAAGSISSAGGNQGDLLGQILGPAKPEERKAESAGTDDGDALGEVEKSLGLR